MSIILIIAKIDEAYRGYPVSNFRKASLALYKLAQILIKEVSTQTSSKTKNRQNQFLWNMFEREKEKSKELYLPAATANWCQF